MTRTRTVVLYGNSVGLAGMAAALGEQDGLWVEQVETREALM